MGNQNLIRQIVEAKPSIDNGSPERIIGGKTGQAMNRKVSKGRLHSLSSMNIGVRVREIERIKKENAKNRDYLKSVKPVIDVQK